jgi:hypothetical protein
MKHINLILFNLIYSKYYVIYINIYEKLDYVIDIININEVFHSFLYCGFEMHVQYSEHLWHISIWTSPSSSAL